jgi:dipeptidyl aminopeptidase/acylaminoacyl peptidase
MAIRKRQFRPEDSLRLKVASDPDLSPDLKRVAFVVADVDEERDRPRSSIWVVAADGSAPARQFTEGPADRSPRWSPDGRRLAYISVTDEVPEHAHVRLAPLDGGVPLPVGDLPGAVSELAWAPDSRQIVVVCRVGLPDREKQTPGERNAPRHVRGLAARLDGVGWRDGRRHLFLVDVETGSAKQLTRGEFDHDHPSFSPDGASIVCAADRSRRRDDRQVRSDAWIVPVDGGRLRRLTNGTGRAAFPLFSPDGTMVAYVGRVTSAWNEDHHVFVVPADGTGQPEQVGANTDRPVLLMFPGQPPPVRWAGDRDLLMLLADRGSVTLHRARVGDRRSKELIGGDIQIDGFAGQPGSRTVAYTASWADRPSELYVSASAAGSAVQLTHLNDDLLAEVELASVGRATIDRPDGTEIEYFTLLPPGRDASRLPLHLEIHGGPHAAWPSGRWLAYLQAIAAAGYCVLLPNPRGSAGYGQRFTAACTGDWGGADCEDTLACCDDLIERGIVDVGRMFVSGASYGGFMTSWIVGRSDRFRAAIAVAAVVDQTSMALTADVPDFVRFNMGGTPWERREEYENRSPLTYLPKVTTPVLVIHWEGDIRVPVSQGEELYTALRLLGKEAEFLRYPGGFHIVRTPAQAVDWSRQVLAWNERHDPQAARRRSPSRRRKSAR